MNVEETIMALTALDPAQSCLLMSNHGIGKSMVVKEAARRMNIPCIDIRLSQCDVGDLKGMPFLINGRTYFAPPDWFPLREEDANKLSIDLGLTKKGEKITLGLHGDKGFLFLDEINRANREVQQAAFEIVLDRRLNMRSLPEGWRVVAACNDNDDLYSVIDFDPAFLDRFFVIKFRPQEAEWFSWAKDEQIHDSVYMFLRKMNKFLYPTNESIKNAVQAKGKVHGPRSWAHLSRSIISMQKAYKDGLLAFDVLERTTKSLDFLFLVAQGHVGNMAATDFKNFIETDYQALDANTILNKWDQDVQKRLKMVVDANRIPELANYNLMIIEYVKDKIKKDLTPKQSQNLLEYCKMVPNEVCSDFWKKFNNDCREVSQKWYKESGMSPDIKKRILGVLANPETLKNQK